MVLAVCFDDLAVVKLRPETFRWRVGRVRHGSSPFSVRVRIKARVRC